MRRFSNFFGLIFKRFACLLLFAIFILPCFGQTKDLKPDQVTERELTGAEIHQYKFDLKADQFSQVRVDQKGVDVWLKLLDANKNVLATMDSPSGKEGSETLSFVAEKTGSFILEIVGFEANKEKGSYTVSRLAPRPATAQDKRRVAVEKVFVEGVNAIIAGDARTETAYTKLKESYRGWQELNDSYLTDLTGKTLKFLAEKKYAPVTAGFFEELQKINKVYDEGVKLALKSKADSLAAREKINEVLKLSRDLKIKLYDKKIETEIVEASKFSPQLFVFLKSLRYYAKSAENNALDTLAQTFYNLGEWKEYLDAKKRSVASWQELATDKDLASAVPPESVLPIRFLIVMGLQQIGSALDSYLGQTENAVEYLNQALKYSQDLYQENKNSQAKLWEAKIWRQMALTYDRESKNSEKVVEFYKKSLEILHTFPDQKDEEANVLLLIANRYLGNFNYTEARNNFKQALQIYRDTDNKWGQAMILQTLGLMSEMINNEREAKDYFNESLQILQSPDYVENYKKMFARNTSSGATEIFDIYTEINDAFIEYIRFNSIGFVYMRLPDFPKALEYYQKALAVARQRKDLRDTKQTLSDLGYASAELKRWDEAADYYRQSLEISRETGNREDIAKCLLDVGWALLESGKPQEALKYQNEALVEFQSAGVDENKAFSPSFSALLNDISRAYYNAGNRRLAIFYGKRAVNAMQGERQRLQNLDAVSQKGFLEKKEKHYRRLSDWLIENGNFAQAEKVLALLKQEEFLDFVRRDANEIGKLDERIPLSEEEKTVIQKYSLLADKVSEIGKEFTILDDKKRKLSRSDQTLSPEEQKRYEELEKQLATANAAFQLFLTKELAAEIGKEKAGAIEVDRSLQDKLRKWGAGTVALYTVAGADRYRVILTTPKTQIDGKTEIKIADLNKKVFAFRAALQNPHVDPRPLGKELYDILVKPIEKELKDAGAKTLVWSLDGTLRYIPLAALSPDGKKYLVEDYQNVIITAKTRDDMTVSNAAWEALGLGVSEGQTVPNPDDKSKTISFEPLPGTMRELETIVKDEKSATDTGVLEGKSFINNGFTTAALKDSLAKENEDGRRKYNVVHIASHFRLGNSDSNSFILLGSGQILTLEEIRNSSTIDFGDVELVTLSACNTGFADDTNGKEIDSLASVIQTKSGKAVLATLWAVADESTSLLMSEFYRLRKENPKLTKAEAMQTAQKAMIEGTLQAKSTNQKRSDLASAGTDKSTASPFATDEKKPFAHPYYWSPFVLIGNWR